MKKRTTRLLVSLGAVFVILFLALLVINPKALRLAGAALNLTTIPCSDVSDLPPEECAILQSFYNSTNGDAWSNNEGWFQTTMACGWHGITCENGHIVSIDLQANQLSGVIPPELGGLAQLRTLSLGGNRLGGGIPAELAALTGLQILDLHANQLSGGIPPQLGNLKNLVRLYLNFNQLSGGIPEELSLLRELEELALHINQLDGPIPPQLGNLEKLKWLHLSSNQLSGGIPAELGNLGGLEQLHLHENQFNGGIPSNLGQLVGLQELILGRNQLNGAIPSELGALVNLRMLYLNDNQLSGAIPPELGALGNLQTLDLSNNQLDGSIPPTLSGMAILSTFYLDNNRLSGAIPEELSALTQLQVLEANSNALSGEFPAEICDLMAADPNAWKYIDIGYNMLDQSDPALVEVLNSRDPDWYETQTLAPTNLQAASSGAGVLLTWTPIAYAGDGGHYEISYATDPGDAFMVHGNTADKLASSYQVDGLETNVVHYFRLRTYTPAHSQQMNELWSDYTSPATASFADLNTSTSIYLPIVIR